MQNTNQWCKQLDDSKKKYQKPSGTSLPAAPVNDSLPFSEVNGKVL